MQLSMYAAGSQVATHVARPYQPQCALAMPYPSLAMPAAKKVETMTEEALRREMQELGKRADSTMADTFFFEKDLGLCRDTKTSPKFQSTLFRAMRPFESA